LLEKVLWREKGNRMNWQIIRRILGILLGLLAICILGFWGLAYWWGNSMLGMCGGRNQIIKSPDGRFVAVISRSNCGAIGCDQTEVGVAMAHEMIPTEYKEPMSWQQSRALWMVEDPSVSVRWAGNSGLYIHVKDHIEMEDKIEHADTVTVGGEPITIRVAVPKKTVKGSLRPQDQRVL
jgi:hypothetical protein